MYVVVRRIVAFVKLASPVEVCFPWFLVCLCVCVSKGGLQMARKPKKKDGRALLCLYKCGSRHISEDLLLFVSLVGAVS